MVAVALVALYLVWGSTYLAMRFAVEGLPPLGMGGVRFVLAGSVLLAIVRWRGLALPTKKQWALSVPLGALFFLCGNGLVVIAEKTIDSSIAAVVCATTPLVAGAIGGMMGERPSRAEVIGTALGLSGVAVLAFGSPLATSGARGLFVLFAPVGWAIGSMLSRRAGATGLGCAASQMISGGVWMLLASALAGEHVPAELSFRSAFAWSYLVLFGSLVGFSAYVFLLGRTRPAVAMSYAYVNPIVAVLLGALLGGEHIGPATILATALIAAGVMCAVMLRARVLRVDEASCSRSTSGPATSLRT
jgi:drug/metabolite transporter (DMT)-like permease